MNKEMNKTEQEIIAGIMNDLKEEAKGQIINNILLYIMNKRDIDKFSSNGVEITRTNPETILITVD